MSTNVEIDEDAPHSNPWDDSLRYDIVPYTRGIGIEFNPSKEGKAFPQFVGITGGDDYHLGLFANNAMSFVVLRGQRIQTASGVEYHDPEVDVAECWRVIKYDGHLVFCDCDELPKKMGGLKGWTILEDSKRLYVARKALAGQRHQLAMADTLGKKTVAVVRYGAIGDIIQTSSILACLKKQGYYVVLNTHSDSYEIIKNDPNVDHFVLQDKDQVPNSELSQYWDHMAAKFDRYINLSESVEGTFLAIPGRTPYYWPQKTRHEMMNYNYLEFMHLLAEVPYDPKPRFYPTSVEKKWAEKQRKKIGGTIIMWLLGGSSVHKTWPYLDQAIAHLMLEYPDVHVVTAGDELCQALELSWEEELRVIRKSGVWTVRESLTFAEIADIVIGPETGILNAVSHLDVPKIVTMSHSSPENLTRDWRRCISLTPNDCECWPCHMMQYGFNYCHRDEETGVALCQARIPAEKMIKAIDIFLNSNWKRKVA